MARVIEAGHYYQAKGPTIWSVVGWRVMEEMRQFSDQTMLFIDDFHGVDDLLDEERRCSVVEFDPEVDHCVFEASMVAEAVVIFQMLMGLSKKQGRPRFKRRDSTWNLNGSIRLKHGDGRFTCVMLDAGLCLYKGGLGFTEGVNVVPVYCESEQRNLLRILRKVNIDFSLRVVLFDLDGESWDLET